MMNEGKVDENTRSFLTNITDNNLKLEVLQILNNLVVDGKGISYPFKYDDKCKTTHETVNETVA